MPKQHPARRVPGPALRRGRTALFFTVALALLATLPGFSGDAAASRASGVTSARQADAVRLALDYVRHNRDALGVRASDLADVGVSDAYVTGDTGATHVYLVQRHRGIEVSKAIIAVTVARDGSVSASASRFVSNLDGRIAVTSPGRSAAHAVERAATHLGLEPKGLAVEEQRGGPAQEVVFNRAGISLEPIHARLVYEPVGGALRLAWEVEVYEPSAEHWWNMRVDAATGDVLAKDDYVAHVGGGQYTVFAIPSESPDDGPRTVANDPAVAPPSPWGWHDTNGSPGAEYTFTRGNNVYAYTDTDANNSADTGSSPSGGSTLAFNFPLDLTKPPSAYRPASVTNLFYWSNVIHDVFYNHGFTEAAGNFQSNNYGRGGRGQDPVLAESQDGSGKNNANFSTPRDGFAPRMQMFEWTFPFVNTVVVGTSAYDASSADFGPQLTESGLSGTVVNARDGGGTSTTDACEALVSFTSGAIALVDRGTCSFSVKVKNAQNAGAKAVIVVNNNDAPAASMGGTDSTITISSVMVSKADGNAIRLLSQPSASVKRKPASEQQPARDSSFDNGVVAHEYGHGISNRLTGGPSKTNCLGNNEQMGEGWSDFIALVLTANASETGATARGMGTYLTWEDSGGFGIRPTPYSTDMSVDPVTYGQLPSLAVPHGVGYAWASMLWEVYWNLVVAKGFNSNIYAAWNTGGNNGNNLALRLVIDGMKLQPCSPGFVDGRNAIVEADRLLTGGANKCAIWRGFAKRGLGANASQGSSGSVTDGREDFALPAGC